MTRLMTALSLLTLLSACASKPILAPNAKYNRVGHHRSEQDINMCMNAADKQLEKTKDRRVIKSAAIGAVAGGVVGGIAGGSGGGVGTLGGAAMGAGAGAIGGALVGNFSTPKEAKRGLVNYCLKHKGYEVAGWDD